MGTTLVTGAAGFLGTNLCRKLLRNGQKVIGLDDLSTGQKRHIDELSQDKCFEFILHDLCEPIRLKADRIFNLACPASPPAYQADPIKTVLVNVVGVRNMLEVARLNNARMVQASTSEVYGDPSVHPQTESYRGDVNTTGPRACYDEGKRCAETLMYEYRRVHSVDTRMARIFNTYGPDMREDDGRVITNMIVQALSEDDVTVYGDGSQTRSFCFVDDMVDGLVRLMSQDTDLPFPINLGNPEEISILDLAHRIIDLTGSNSRIVHLPASIDDPKVRCPDISCARAQLGWNPHVSLEEGLKATISHFRELTGERNEGMRVA